MTNLKFDRQRLTELAKRHLDKLCVEITTRQVGSVGNQAATDYFAACLQSSGFQVERQSFNCVDWEDLGAGLLIEEANERKVFSVAASPYSLGAEVYAPLAVAASIADLEKVDAVYKVLLLRGELAKEQLMSKNFPFYNPDEHQLIYRLLEQKAPLAIIAATGRNPELAGGVYPFPLIEDGDFDIPSVFTTEEEGERLAKYVGENVFLTSKSRRIPSTGCNVTGRKGAENQKRIVVTAHIDAKLGTPGALDNAAGVIVLLLLADLLRDYTGERMIEIVALNGEDYYAASGEIAYLKKNQDLLDEILFNINLDGVGYFEGKTAWSFYECPDDISSTVQALIAGRSDMLVGDSWYQSDHMIFVQNGVPAIAITSEYFWEIGSRITHTPEDRPELLQLAKLVNIADTLSKLVQMDISGA